MTTNTAELKNYLQKFIVETDDESILNKIRAYFTILEDENVDWWNTISDKEKDAINIGLQQLENGEGIAHADVKRKVDELFYRK